jgi:GMP synthase (glutamine-hydrolysing)
MMQVIQFSENNSIGYLHNFLPDYKIFNISMIEHIDCMKPMILLGSPASVNDNKDWVFSILNTVKKAIKNQTPILGICFGAQIIAKCLGEKVEKIPIAEYGWYDLQIDITNSKVFQWHEEGFKLPKNTTLLSENINTQYCNAFSYNNILATQFHFEITQDAIDYWLNHQIKDGHLKNKISEDTNLYLKQFHVFSENIIKKWLLDVQL